MRELIYKSIQEMFDYYGKDKSIDEHFKNHKSRWNWVNKTYREFCPSGPVDFNNLTDEQLVLIYQRICKCFYNQM